MRRRTFLQASAALVALGSLPRVTLATEMPSQWVYDVELGVFRNPRLSKALLRHFDVAFQSVEPPTAWAPRGHGKLREFGLAARLLPRQTITEHGPKACARLMKHMMEARATGRIVFRDLEVRAAVPRHYGLVRTVAVYGHGWTVRA